MVVMEIEDKFYTIKNPTPDYTAIKRHLMLFTKFLKPDPEKEINILFNTIFFLFVVIILLQLFRIIVLLVLL